MPKKGTRTCRLDPVGENLAGQERLAVEKLQDWQYVIHSPCVSWQGKRDLASRVTDRNGGVFARIEHIDEVVQFFKVDERLKAIALVAAILVYTLVQEVSICLTCILYRNIAYARTSVVQIQVPGDPASCLCILARTVPGSHPRNAAM
jgi:hypothetical protein